MSGYVGTFKLRGKLDSFCAELYHGTFMDLFWGRNFDLVSCATSYRPH